MIDGRTVKLGAFPISIDSGNLDRLSRSPEVLERAKQIRADLGDPERRAMGVVMDEARRAVMEADRTVEGFNVGMNCGEAAGQTVRHAHVHLIPRRKGDVEEPRGGVRGVIPGKAGY